MCGRRKYRSCWRSRRNRGLRRFLDGGSFAPPLAKMRRKKVRLDGERLAFSIKHHLRPWRIMVSCGCQLNYHPFVMSQCLDKVVLYFPSQVGVTLSPSRTAVKIPRLPACLEFCVIWNRPLPWKETAKTKIHEDTVIRYKSQSKKWPKQIPTMVFRITDW